MTQLRTQVLALLLLTASVSPSVATEPPTARRKQLSAEADYIDFAQHQAPELVAIRRTAEARRNEVSAAGRLPEPTAGVGLFVRSVETRTGPQEARVSLQQTLPWPTELVASRSKARHTARSAEADVKATSLAIQSNVRQAYWALWEIRRTRSTRADHLVLLGTLAETTRSRLETGSASLADLQQIELAIARLADDLASLDEQELAAEANLRAAVGIDDRNEALETGDERPAATLPSISDDQLLDLALSHPRVTALRELGQAAAQQVRVARASRAPALRGGVDWIITGEATDSSMADSGKDAWVATAGIRLPVWQRGYAKDVAAAQGTKRARDARVRDAEFGQSDHLIGALSAVRDTARRHLVLRDTLIPQAEAAYTSALGEYAVGEAEVAQILLAQKDLLDLRVGLDTTAAAHARSWATLEATCGAAIPRRAADGEIDELE